MAAPGYNRHEEMKDTSANPGFYNVMKRKDPPK